MSIPDTSEKERTAIERLDSIIQQIEIFSPPTSKSEPRPGDLFPTGPRLYVELEDAITEVQPYLEDKKTTNTLFAQYTIGFLDDRYAIGVGKCLGVRTTYLTMFDENHEPTQSISVSSAFKFRGFRCVKKSLKQ